MKRILIVEDELVVRSIYRRKFELAGYQVETAEEGAAALKMLPLFRPDIIQVDIMLPGIDGVEVIRQIRAWPEFQNVPILVLSSFYRPDLAKEAWKAGANKCVSKMDCTPNLALELIEQLLSGENTTFLRKFANIPMSQAALEPATPSPAPPPGAPDPPKPTFKMEETPSQPEPPKVPFNPDAAFSGFTSQSRPTPSAPSPAPPAEVSASEPKMTVDLHLPPSTRSTPTLPDFTKEKEEPAVAEPAKPAFFGKTAPPPFRPTTRPSFVSATPKPVEAAPPPPPPAPAPPESQPAESAEPAETSGPDFRIEIRKEFLKRAPQIQAELRERTGALIRSKSATDQLRLLHGLGDTVSSLSSLSGITGFSRISHLSGALDALIKDLHKRPSQMTASVLRTIAHAMDCLNVLFRDLSHVPQDIPQSILILVVDDEPISRRTISVALAKANLRCVGLEDPRMALTVLKENPFDLIFLDAEMPVLNGFELCAELRKLNTNKTTPVIFVTSLTKFEVRAQSSLSGGNDLIAKPFLMMELAVKALTYLLKPPLSVEAKIRPAQPAA